MIRAAGLVDFELGPSVDAFAGAAGEEKARQVGTRGYPFSARKPG